MAIIILEQSEKQGKAIQDQALTNLKRIQALRAACLIDRGDRVGAMRILSDFIKSDFTDEQMFAMDNAISGAFKSMGKGKKKADQKIELQKRNFKLRVLDLVEIFMKRNSKSPNQFLFVKPLLKCARAKTESPLSQKAGKMVSKVMPSEKVGDKTAPMKLLPSAPMKLLLVGMSDMRFG